MRTGRGASFPLGREEQQPDQPAITYSRQIIKGPLSTRTDTRSLGKNLRRSLLKVTRLVVSIYARGRSPPAPLDTMSAAQR